MKHLPKHLRPRWRYLAVGIETWPDASFGRRAFQRAVWYAAQNLLGDTGSAETDMTVVQFHGHDGSAEAIVRTRRGQTDEARAAVTCVNRIDDDEVRVRIRGSSGTVRACEEKYIRGPPEPPEQRHVVFANADRSATVRPPRYDVETASDGAFVGATALDFR
ncbi:MAG: Rpp14/Pop5 family protein [Haloarcula sp.]